ncbi:molybdate ABC transporter substrate-binding protein [Nocardioides sp. zg-DK7169]|uniref:molybdate ABC transporter substrate-binding protein n=1 Tax=Nocardioides sp. zg-DK7169 TaxID=2736600 RepID=UPI0015521BC8|nr:molybdate ABC transporter substrate-binding protein [Nocardioides sp. zg-DK7169]NPC95794.1 molybdate ABC transporter substrate-binding protein [Nocardioides sp. zg-DK7169]
MPARARRIAGLVAALALLAGVPGCGADDSRTLTVYAAASLQAPLDELVRDFEAGHDDVHVTVSYAGSSDLVAQISQGARADVLATADTVTMDRLVAEDLTDGVPAVLATNTLSLAVPPGNPAGVTGLADLARDDLTVVVCAPQVPCGAAAQRLADLAGVRLAPDSEEQSVTDVLGKVTSGEADAGLVYRTDVLAAGDRVEGVEVPEADRVVNDYPVAVVADAPQDRLAADFVALLLGDTGRRILERAGFGPPR